MIKNKKIGKSSPMCVFLCVLVYDSRSEHCFPRNPRYLRQIKQLKEKMDVALSL